MKNKSTYFIFDGKKIIISSDLQPIVGFLEQIEKEIKSLLGVEEKLESIRKQYKEMVELVEVLAGKIKENSMDFNFTFSEDPSNIADKLKFNRPIRSEMIVLFANLETLFCLNLAYENKTFDKDEIRKLATNSRNVEDFIKRFCLTQDNEWIKYNPERLKDTTAKDIRYLRNNLTHFFSVDEKLGIIHPALNEKARRVERKMNASFKFISTEDLYGIIKGAAKLMILKWSKDYEEDSDEFRQRISFVKNIIKKRGAVIIKENQLNI